MWAGTPELNGQLSSIRRPPANPGQHADDVTIAKRYAAALTRKDRRAVTGIIITLIAYQLLMLGIGWWAQSTALIADALDMEPGQRRHRAKCAHRAPRMSTPCGTG